MATTGEGAAERQSEKTGISQIVVVDIDEAQPSQRVKLLRKGRGKLMARVERIVAIWPRLGQSNLVHSQS